MKNLSVSQIYFYLVAFISLLVVIFSLHSAATLTFRQYILKTLPVYTYQPPFLPFLFNPPVLTMPLGTFPVEDISQQEKTNTDLLNQLKENKEISGDQKAQIDQWFKDYQIWKEVQQDEQKRYLDALIGNILSLAIFAPVFIYHFRKARQA